MGSVNRIINTKRQPSQQTTNSLGTSLYGEQRVMVPEGRETHSSAHQRGFKLSSLGKRRPLQT